ncbi:WAS/WASL-interacting protein family member 3 [Elgaria multicarinata webbii]|uniref:WAS/WASL-interacting protein family member 3 n=1 Tax=Elgaria multicarinata webbii TaxID=159646 RepID=UPI002FCD67B3
MFLQFFTANTEPPKVKREDSKSRSALLHEIQRGTRLRRVSQTNDRSAPHIESCRRRASRDGGSSGNNRNSDVPQALGNLFADGFPVLRPVSQRDLIASRTGKPHAVRTSLPPTAPAPLNNHGKASGNLQMTADDSKPADQSEAPRVPRVVPLRLSIPAPAGIPAPPSVPAPSPPPQAPPPLLPTSSNKPSLIFPPPPPLPPPLVESPDKLLSPNSAAAAAPSQSDKPPKTQASPLHLPSHPPPPPPPLPPVPPCGLAGRASECSSPSSSQPDLRIHSPPMPPPPPPPPVPSMSTFAASHRTSLSPPPSPTSNSALSGSSDPTAPPLPPKSPFVQSQLQKPGIQSLPLPPAPPVTQQVAATHRRRQGRGGAKLMPPPLPPARSPTTELTSKCQYAQVSPWLVTHDLYPSLKNGTVHIMDDFESKFTFHSVEEFPPPDEFKPCQKIYPSQEARDSTNNPPLRTQVR